MIKVINQYTRPSTDISFYSDPNFKTYVSITYIMSGKFKSETMLSEDGLTKTTSMSWDSSDDYLDFLKDPIVTEHGAKRQQYCKEKQIITTKIKGN